MEKEKSNIFFRLYKKDKINCSFISTVFCRLNNSGQFRLFQRWEGRVPK